MSQSVITYINPAHHTASDSDLVEVASNVGRLKVQTYAGETFYASYVSDINGTRGDGVLTGTAFGGASIVNNKLDLKGGTLKYVSYAADLNAAIANVGTISITFTPDYTGAPSFNTYLCSESGSSGNINGIEILHEASSGKLFASVYDSTGSLIFQISSAGDIGAVSGVKIYVELNIDTTASSRLFVGGAIVASSSATGTRTAPTSIQVGTNISKTGWALFDIDYFHASITVQHTESFIPAKPTTYSLANPSLQLVTGIGMDSLEGFAESVTLVGLDLVKYVLTVDGVDKYWDGAVWSTSIGYSQSNTATEIEANKYTLDISLGASVQPKVYLHGNLGETTPTITSMTVNYDFFAAMIPLNVSKVYGYVTHNLSPIVSVRGFIKSTAVFFVDGNTISVDEFIRVNSNGYFEIDIPRSPEKLTYEITYKVDGKDYIKNGKLIANVAEIELEDAVAAAG